MMRLTAITVMLLPLKAHSLGKSCEVSHGEEKSVVSRCWNGESRLDANLRCITVIMEGISRWGSAVSIGIQSITLARAAYGVSNIISPL